jgi:hypothetical protein
LQRRSFQSGGGLVHGQVGLLAFQGGGQRQRLAQHRLGLEYLRIRHRNLAPAPALLRLHQLQARHLGHKIGLLHVGLEGV